MVLTSTTICWNLLHQEGSAKPLVKWDITAVCIQSKPPKPNLQRFARTCTQKAATVINTDELLCALVIKCIISRSISHSRCTWRDAPAPAICLSLRNEDKFACKLRHALETLATPVTLIVQPNDPCTKIWCLDVFSPSGLRVKFMFN